MFPKICNKWGLPTYTYENKSFLFCAVGNVRAIYVILITYKTCRLVSSVNKIMNTVINKMLLEYHEIMNL